MKPEGAYDWPGLVRAFAREPRGFARAASDARRDGGLDNPAGGDTGVSQPGTNPDGTTTGNVGHGKGLKHKKQR